MNLDNEISEFRKSFSDSSPLARVLMVLGFFFTLSSITSISSLIIEWQGFILDAINFYHNYFVLPVSQIAEKVGFSYSQMEIHVATMSSICIAVGMRILCMGHAVAFREINLKYNSNSSPNFVVYCLIAIILPLLIWGWYGYSEPPIYPLMAVFTVTCYPIFITAPKFIASKFGEQQFEQGKFSYFKSYYLYMAAIFIIIGVLAGINAGLHETTA
ncbi:hypothetical protein QWY82_02485 [Simiduia curdlanivorans]|uniref:Uncharacterized protein n=1 Tax=Simiduia curdlanivorans TaxID=1492769 RepID=A0ABV8V2M6_9GAMM|nr:hypothetical protein [Simiduia curdlanivorans]MDN3637666.1 hypothetical protein [Simiduia curdlanivorans]